MMVKCYDMNKLIQAGTDGAFTAFGPYERLVVLQGPQGFVVVCHEGVSWLMKSDEEIMEVEGQPNDEDEHPDSFRLMATHLFKMPVKEVMTAPSEEVRLGDFVRRFGRRLEDNYRILLSAIKQVGLDPADYPRDVA